jgi:hypothetical protein
MELLPLTTFKRCVARYGGEHKVKHFACLDQYLCMAFAQLTWRESLRDIEACLRAHSTKLIISASAALRTRLDHNRSVPSVFSWAPFRSTKAAVKLHTLLDLRGSIPAFIFISDGKFHDVNVLDDLVPEPGAFYVMDRAYIDFERLANDAGSFFVTRAKSNFRAQRRYSHAVDRATGLVCDQTVVGFYSRKGLEAPLRRVKFNAPKWQAARIPHKQLCIAGTHDRPVVPAALACGTVFQMDQTAPANQGVLRTTENAVKTQIWIAVSVYILVAIVKKRLSCSGSLYEMLQILSLKCLSERRQISYFRSNHRSRTSEFRPTS